MFKNLTEGEIDEVLLHEWYGHMGTVLKNGYPYVIPVTYVYSENCLFTYSFEGKKIDSLRKNPKVCFQVQTIISDHEWNSVVVWGEYVELSGKDKDDAFALVLSSLWKDESNGKTRMLPFHDSRESMEKAINDEDVVLYKIQIKKMTGRYEMYE